jgi:hypothetical protein
LKPTGIVHETHLKNNNQNQKKAGGVAQVVELLPTTCRYLYSATPVPPKKDLDGLGMWLKFTRQSTCLAKFKPPVPPKTTRCTFLLCMVRKHSGKRGNIG